MDNLLKLPFKPWQQEAVRRMTQQRHFCVFDTVGVGKTIEAIGALQFIASKESLKALVVVESPHVFQWKEELERFSYLDIFYVKSSSREARLRSYKTFMKSKESSALIINYGKLRFDFDVLRSMYLTAIIYDEALILSNFNETRKYACWLNSRVKYVFALTATPMSRDIMQWFNLFECIGVKPLERESFLENFAVYSIDKIRTKRGTINKLSVTGAKNIPLLKELYGDFYIRRRKKDIKRSIDIIEHIVHYRLYPLDKEQNAAYAKIKDGYIQMFRGSVEDKRLEPLTAYTTMLQVLDSAYLIDYRLQKTSPKLEGLLKTLEEIGESKVFIYSRFKVFGDIITEALNKREEGSAVFLHGDLDIASFDKKKNSFLKDSRVKYLVATDIAQRGLNLQISSTIVFMDLPMTPDAIVQLVGRLDREGQESPFINIFFMLSDNSVERNVFNLLRERQKVFDALLDEDKTKMFSISKEEFINLL